MQSQAEILQYYEREGAVWFYDYSDDRKAPHAKLTSGLCSDGYVNSAPVLSRPDLTALLARELKAKLGHTIEKIDWVVGSPYAAITLSYELARQIGARHAFPEKDPKDPKKMVWNSSRFSIPANAMVLQCEELITTLGTAMEVRGALCRESPNVVFFPRIAAAVHRPVTLKNDGLYPVVALIEREVKSWSPEECPLCRLGSESLRPREGENWAKLTGKA